MGNACTKRGPRCLAPQSGPSPAVYHKTGPPTPFVPQQCSVAMSAQGRQLLNTDGESVALGNPLRMRAIASKSDGRSPLSKTESMKNLYSRGHVKVITKNYGPSRALTDDVLNTNSTEHAGGTEIGYDWMQRLPSHVHSTPKRASQPPSHTCRHKR